MAPSPLRSKALHHSRSLSLPSASHPLISQVDDNLSRLRSSEGTSSSLSSINGRVNDVRNLYESIDELLLLPHVQQIISEECVDDYIKLLDACTTVKDAVRRKDAHGINCYISSRKNSKKMIQKSLKNMRRCATAGSDKGYEETSVVQMLKEAQSAAFSHLESLLSYTLGAKSGRSMVSKLMKSKKVSDDENEFNMVDSFLKQSQENELVNHLKEMDSSIQVLEEEVESIFRQLIKTRVSLLNTLNH